MEDNPSVQKSGPRSIIGPLNVYGILALAGIIGPIMFVSANITASFSNPEYSFIRDSISSLALTPMGWLQTIGFLVVGLLGEAFVVGLFFSIRRGRGFALGIATLVSFSFGLLLLGAFRTDPVGTPHTIEGTIHSVTATIVFWLFPIACLLVAPSLRQDSDWKHLFLYTIVTGIFNATFLIIRIWLPEHLNWFGLYERILLVSILIWLAVMAIQLLRLSLTVGWKT